VPGARREIVLDSFCGRVLGIVLSVT
jgi:hypothetical protein